MITQVSIKDLRGIAEGTVGELTPLTILTGVNGSGKSTVLDSLLIGSSAFPGGAIGQAILRRASRQFTAEWLFRRRAQHASLALSIDGVDRLVELSWLSQESARVQLEQATALGAVEARVPGFGVSSVAFLEDGGMVAQQTPYGHPADAVSQRPIVRLIDMRGAMAEQRELTDVLTDAKSAGFGGATVALLGSIAPGLRNLEIIKVGTGYEVGLVYDDSAVPLSMAGDGIRAVARLALELAALPKGLALLEEPEVHQHPGALKLSAATIVAAVKRGLQVIVATHSLELIDELLLAAKKSEMLDKLTVQNLRLAGGVLTATRYEGPESDEIRNVIGTELR